MAEFGINAPFKAVNVEARVEKTTVQIGNIYAAFAGDKRSMLEGFGLTYASDEQIKLAQAV